MNFIDLLSAFTFGVKDSTSLCAVTTLLTFLIFLSWIGVNRTRLWLGGAFFLLAFISITAIIDFGLLDRLLGKSWFINCIHVGYCFLSIIFILIGLIHLRDWYQYKRKGDNKYFMINLLFLYDVSGDNSSTKKTGKLAVIFFSIVLGLIMGILNSSWPSDQGLYNIFYVLTSGQKTGLAVTVLLLYGSGLCITSVFAWLIYLWILGSLNAKSFLANWISFVKIICSAVFLSVGMGVAYFYLLS